MILLRADWLTEGLIDFEYKKYVLLGYLLSTKAAFKNKKLYPVLPNLARHYAYMDAIKKNREMMEKGFPRIATGIDTKNMCITYEDAVKDEENMQEIEKIVEFSLPKVKEILTVGEEIHKKVEEELSVFPVGFSSENLQEGYILVHLYYSNKIAIYEYKISTSDTPAKVCQEKMHIHTNLLGWEHCNEHTTLEDVKKKVGRKSKYKNPYTLAVTCDGKYPIVQTLLPITEKIILKRLATRI